MSSGKKSAIINTQERAVSTDINRLQAFAAHDDAELFRYMLDVTDNDDLTTGNITENATLETPLRAEIINGFLVTARTGAGALDLFVAPGLLYAIAPDTDTDASNYKYVKDPGIQSLSTLLITPNASGSTRIDVIEVQVGYAISETDNRDIFNPSTGLFAATSLSKARQGNLTYRVRAGTPGGGFPGTASGWLPLAVACVPTGTTSNDTIDFWDVRPLISDRKNLMAVSQSFPVIEQLNYSADGHTASTCIINGIVKAQIGSRRIGGLLKRGTPGTDANTTDLLAAANVEPGFTIPAAGGFFYVYLLTPFSLPRWARYTDVAFGARVPRNPRGIMVTSRTAPYVTGAPSSAISLPTSTGLSGSTTAAICIGSFVMNSAGTPLVSSSSSGRTQWASGLESGGSAISVAGSVNAAYTRFTMIEGTTHPANAKALWVKATLIASFAVNAWALLSASFFKVYGPGATLYPFATVGAAGNGTSFGNTTAGTTSFGPTTGLVRIPVPMQYPTVPGSNWNLDWYYGAFNQIVGSPTVTSVSLEVCGWDL